ncbi:hypothetical protein ALC62_00710 [Cyphomyrmex costatus]|uniref:Mutator-like transposase domain-containing protein n=1 Tax=Cyphomyrmex costatus TaxID=456900 RepID=A0A151IQ79_9HYME|nr:hypothetical protein ALC62_00710 [Cyphomyrmex costatus]
MEFEEFMESYADKCCANHTGSAGKMEVDAAVEMFSRLEELHNIRYSSYVGDGDSKTFKDIVESQPYGEDCIVVKKECVGHVQKRMGVRLRKLKKETKGLGGKGKLTAKLIDELSVFYGLAIRRNSNSAENMKKAIWATLKHKVLIASYIAASIFNDGYGSILKMLHVLNVIIGPNAVATCADLDETRISIADARSYEASKEGRIHRRELRSAAEEAFCEEEDSFYEARMAD